MSYIPNLRTKFVEEIAPALKEDLGFQNKMEIPKLLKICINQGVGLGVTDKKLVTNAVEELTAISGQQAVQTIAKKSISNFKLREGMPIGARVTLRGNRMYEFLERFVTVALPRVRDFRGINNKSFDGRGNYTLGITEQIIFPEIDIDKVNKISGMDITFVTSAKTDQHAYVLLEKLGLPFKKPENKQ